MGTKSRETIYGASVRAAARRRLRSPHDVERTGKITASDPPSR
jgi:hypothetical protein